MEENYNKKEQEVKKLGYKDLGWDNGRAGLTDEQKYCSDQKHKKFDIQGNRRGSKNIKGCEMCRWFSYYDCSD